MDVKSTTPEYRRGYTFDEFMEMRTQEPSTTKHFVLRDSAEPGKVAFGASEKLKFFKIAFSAQGFSPGKKIKANANHISQHQPRTPWENYLQHSLLNAGNLLRFVKRIARY